MALPLSPQVFAIISHLIEEQTGIHYGIGESDLLAERLSVRAAELELGSLLDYYYFLRYDEGGRRELDLLIDALVVNETYFFRELDQLRGLVDLLIAPALETKATFRIWNAACSTGEEPLSLAMLLDERALLSRVDILATDISARALARAERGLYGGRALRAVTPAQRARFLDAGEGLVRVDPSVHAHVRWQRLNLFDFDRVAALGTFDAILCRNALIYFRDESIVRLVEELARALEPGGHLLVGASESLLRFGTALTCEEHAGAFYYRKASP